jgi:hypothetical protein
VIAAALAKRFVPPLQARGRLRRPPSRIVAVIAGPNPSFDYYLQPRLQCAGGLPFSVADVHNTPDESLDGAFVLFCRYMSGAWLGAVERNADRIAGVGLFLDDDIDALFADPSVPLDYRGRLARLALMHRRRLARVLDILFVATPVLASRYHAANPRILTPLASAKDEPLERAPSASLRIAMHSTSVHAAENRWLRPVMAAALGSHPAISLEVIADPLRALPWRRHAGVHITPPMRWPAYRAHSREQGADLLLAPLLPTPANAARSATKRIDAMRLGAALMISDPAVYRPDTEETALGMSVPAEPAQWIAAIKALAHDRERVIRLRDLNRAHVQAMSTSPQPLLLNL